MEARCCATSLILLVLAVALVSIGSVECVDGVYAVGVAHGVTGSNFGGNTEPGICARTPEERSPADLDALRSLILAQDDDMPYTVVGARHSWSNVVQGRCLLSLEHFKEITVFRNANPMTVRVGAGVRFGELQEKLHEENLTLANYGAVNVQTVVGGVQTGTHGSGTGGVHTLVQAMRILHVSSNGTLQEQRFTLADEPRAVADWAMSMGNLGVVLDVDLKIIESFNLKRTLDGETTVLSLNNAPGFLKCDTFGAPEDCRSEFAYAPQLSPDTVMGFLCQVTTDPVGSIASPPKWNRTDIPPMLFDAVNPSIADNYLLLSSIHPLLRLLGSFGFSESMPTGRKVEDGLLTLGRTEHQAVRHVEMEIFVHHDDALKALMVVRNLYEDPRRKHYHAYIFYARRVTQDPPLPSQDGVLAPTFVNSPFADRDTMTLSVFYYGTRMNSRYRPFCQMLLGKLRQELDHEVRVHPGKWTPEEAPADDRRSAAKAEWDPLNRFSNDYFSR